MIISYIAGIGEYGRAYCRGVPDGPEEEAINKLKAEVKEAGFDWIQIEGIEYLSKVTGNWIKRPEDC